VIDSLGRSEDDSRLSGSGLSNFDPSSLAAGDVHVLNAPQVINEYVEKYLAMC